jgi:hypothetical protein
MTGVKLRDSERWKHRRKPAPIEDAAQAATLAPVETRAERVLIDRWIQHQIVDWPSSHCFGCRKPIVVGQKWLELVCDDNRARFHSDASLCGEPSRKSPLARRCGVKT